MRTPRARPLGTEMRRWLCGGVGGLCVSAAVIVALVKVHELGARWPHGMLGVLAVAGIGCVGLLVWFRLRGLWRFLIRRFA